MHIVFYGPEGSGKGTQAKLLAEKLHLPLITFGDLVRSAAQNDKGLIGQASRFALKEGKYLPDSEAFVLWKRRLKEDDAKKGWIIDGFPRSIGQAEFLLKKIKKYGYPLDLFIYLFITDEEALKRLKKRKRKLFSGSKIIHDDPKRVKERLKVYRSKEKPILDYFKKLGVFRKIDGQRSIKDIHQEILEKVRNSY
ncbi:nucleoside monophosphate kinase [Candidatus Gottesmanbacteria bacterium]|nr:nucleoside monophosphate kinase [Candidatus Gottesmanbacteria bacterium]